MKRDMKSNVGASVSIAPGLRTTSVNGTGVDVRDYDAATFLISTGACTDGAFAIEIQDSDDDSTYAAVADDYLVGTEPTINSDDDNTVYRVGYVGSKRYVRAVATETGASPTPATGCAFGATVLLGLPHILPVS
jgi:hypothetical protein